MIIRFKPDLSYILIGALASSVLFGCETPSDSALSKENGALAAQVERLGAELDVQTELAGSLQRQLDSVVDEEDKLAILSAQRNEAQAQVAALQDQLAGLQTELQATRARELQLNESMNTTLNEFEAVSQELETLKGQLVSSSVDESQRESLIEELQVKQEQVSSQLDVLNAEYLTLQEENKTLRAQLNAVSPDATDSDTTNLDTTDSDTTDSDTLDETLDSRGDDDADTNATNVTGGY